MRMKPITMKQLLKNGEDGDPALPQQRHLRQREMDGEDSNVFNRFTNTALFRVYPVIADQILERTGIRKGRCLEIGSGSASLAMAIALLSELRVIALDISPEMYALAQKNVRHRCMEGLVIPVMGNVHAIPAEDASFDLVISRGSFHIWEDLPVAFREICRVLRPGGMAYVGGGYGNARIRDELLSTLRGQDYASDPACSLSCGVRRVSPEEIGAAITAAGIAEFSVINDDSGLWFLLRQGTKDPGRCIPEGKCNAGAGQCPQFREGFFFPE